MNVITVDKPHVCHFCDKRFGRRYSLRRHIENIHSEEDSEASDQVDTDSNHESNFDNYRPQPKKNKVNQDEDETDGNSDTESIDLENEDVKDETSEPETDKENDETTDTDDSSSDLEDNVGYRDWLEEALEASDQMWREKYQKYVYEGITDEEAKEKANRKTLWAVKQIFFNKYKDFLSSYFNLMHDDTHQEIVEEIEEKVDKGFDINTVLNRVISKYQNKFEGLFHQEEDEEEKKDRQDNEDD